MVCVLTSAYADPYRPVRQFVPRQSVAPVVLYGVLYHVKLPSSYFVPCIVRTAQSVPSSPYPLVRTVRSAVRPGTHLNVRPVRTPGSRSSAQSETQAFVQFCTVVCVTGVVPLIVPAGQRPGRASSSAHRRSSGDGSSQQDRTVRISEAPVVVICPVQSNRPAWLVHPGRPSSFLSQLRCDTTFLVALLACAL